MKQFIYTIILLFSVQLGLLFAQHTPVLNRVEPPFWWTEMKDPHLQLMLYGKQISDLDVFIENTHITLQRVIQVENPNYLFVDLKIDEQSKPQTFKLELRDGDATKLSYDYQLLGREKGSALREGFNTSDVMYLITPDRFVNGDPNNDSVPSLKESVNRNDITGRHGGDLEGIRRSIDYIDQMGFTAIWLNPVLENNQEKYSYHGYSTTDFYKVDERFGSNEDYRSLTKAARNKNIKMIMDMILNHCGSDHWWMEDLPTTDWINFNNTFQVTNHKRTTVQDQYASSYDKKYFADGWFVKTMPDLNQRNPLFATYLIQNTLWWIEYSGLAGIRMDTYPYPDKDFMTHWTKRVMEEYPNFNIVGEEWSTNPAIVSFWQAGKENHNKYISYLPSVMDFPIQHALVNALKEEESWSDGWQKLYEMLALDFLYPDPDNLVVFTDNHDMSRFFTQIDEDISLFKLGMAYLLTIRGIPQIYYGTEILMNNASSPDHGVIRSDFPGGWEEDTINVFNNAGLNTEQVEAQNFLRKLLHWRKTASAIHNGKLMHFAPYKGVYVLFRYSAMDKVMIVLNKNREAVELDLDRYAEILDDHVRASDIITEKEYILKKGGKLFAPARTPLILDFTP